ncbi:MULTISPECIES: trypsin-like peptidase domain-containing protein [unclassified Bacillus (in: firmicutes)]|uniref:S1C family serine protease n=1 Tax=unclassified Bacillus (in: firmicutes) TaxID=185979 RepID=UPI0006AEC4EA|nr:MULTISPECIES: trypsin-like peptidase domain-containing protein [unclassified Bacillus (in: firmicutes)]MDF2067483.1 trypsin-like peptidase domain-containing protein [Bacillus sp. Cr_A10]
MDEYNPYEPEKPEEPKKEKKRGLAGYFFSALAGVMVGALLVWFLIPSVVTNLPSNNEIKSNNTTQETKQLSVDVTTDVTGAVEKASGAVVGITNIQSVTDFWSNSQSTQEAGTGSGVIYKKAGGKAYVITNHHVVEGAKSLEVTLVDGTKVDAKLVGSDIWSDLAVLEMDDAGVDAVIEFGNSDTLKQGETVIAIGNPLGLDFYGSVTTGVVSGKDRAIPVDLNGDQVVDWQAEVLQTDAAINPGNSGGALINLAGQLVGINSMKISESTIEGIGLAIPVNTAIPIIEDLEQNGKVNRPSMGITLLDLTNVPAFHQKETLKLPAEVTTGVVVDEVVPNSPAEKAGMETYDVIVEMDGKKVEDTIDLRKHLYNEKEIGEDLKVKVYRQGKVVELTLKLVETDAL